MQPSESTVRNADARMDKNSQDQWQGGQSPPGHRLHQNDRTSEMCYGGRPPRMDNPIQYSVKEENTFSCRQRKLEVEGKTTTIAVGVSKHITEDILMERDIPHFRHYLKKALDVEPGNDEPGNDEVENDELDTPPTTVTIESGMVVIRAQQLQQDNLEEEEYLQQERDGPIMSVLYPVAEGSEAEELEYDKANKIVPPTDEHDGEAESDEVLDGVITREELSKSQRNGDTLKHIRDKAGINKEPYFWHKGVLMRKTYNTLGKDLIMVPKVARSRILRMAHNSPIAGHYASERTLSTIRTRMDWPGVAKDVKDLCASCPICQNAGPAIIVKAPLNPLPIIKEPFTRIAMDVFRPLNRTKAGNKYLSLEGLCHQVAGGLCIKKCYCRNHCKLSN